MQYFLQDVPINLTLARREEPTLYRLATAVIILRLYASPVMIVIGVLGNLASLQAFRYKKFQIFSNVPFLAATSAADLLFLFTWMLVWFHIYGVDIYGIGGVCQAVTLMTSVCTFLPLWCTVFSVTDRAWAMWAPTRVICTQIKAKMCLAFLVAVSIVVYMNISLLYGVIQLPPDLKLCIPLSASPRTMSTLNQMDAVWNFLLPYSWIAVFTVWFFWKVRVDRTRRNSVISGTALHRSILLPSFGEIDMNKTVLATSAYFFLLNVPGHLLRLYVSAQDHEDAPQNIVYDTKLLLYQQCFFYLFATRISGNFFVYLINPTFREYFTILHVKASQFLSRKSNRKFAVRYSVYSLPMYTFSSSAFCDSEGPSCVDTV